MPYAEASLPQLVVRQPYDVSLQLLVPASESNLSLGNFMAFLTLSTPSNKTLTSVRRPVSRILLLLSGYP
jgi:Putative adipose-regulatory protein (Seipin)